MCNSGLLDLAYAQTPRSRSTLIVIAMALVAVTCGTRRKTDCGSPAACAASPREWDTLTAAIPESDRGGDLSAAYARMLADRDPQIREPLRCLW